MCVVSVYVILDCIQADKGKKALNILRQMYNINNWRHRSPSIFPVSIHSLITVALGLL